MFLGIDAGGSGSRWAVLRSDGSWGDSGDDGPAIQVSELGVDRAAVRIAELLLHTGDRTSTSVAIGLAGVGEENTRRALQALVVARDPRVVIMEDSVSAAAAALSDGPGVAVFAGTGSFAIARDSHGELLRSGGSGCVISDHGSGYWLVRAAAEAAVQAADGIASPTDLAERLRAAFELESPFSLGVAMRNHTVREIARRSAIVIECAVAGDATATEILRAGAGHLADLARSAARKAELDFSTTPVFLGGGTQRNAHYRGLVEQALISHGAGGSIRAISFRPEQGAALVARAIAQGSAPLARWVRGTRA